MSLDEQKFINRTANDALQLAADIVTRDDYSAGNLALVRVVQSLAEYATESLKVSGAEIRVTPDAHSMRSKVLIH